MLAASATPSAIDMLTRVAGGAKKGLLRRYSLNDQLMAIDSLGRSGSLDALLFLKFIYSPTITFTYNSYNTSNYSGGIDVTDTYEVCSYPNASAGLNRALSFSVNLSDYREEEERHRHFTNRYHAVIRTALGKLLQMKHESESAQCRVAGEKQCFDFMAHPIQTRKVLDLLEKGVPVAIDISHGKVRSLTASIIYHSNRGTD